MRVIAGKFKGGKLQSPEIDFVRPTSDKVKEALFNILSSRIENASFLDMFGGSGGVSIEAISRGAADVTVCDSSRDVVKLIRHNLEHFEIDESVAQVVYGDYLVNIRKLYESGKKFDIIFIDPPYRTDYDKKCLERFETFDILSDDGIIILEHDGKKNLLKGCERLKIIDERRYGGTYLTQVVKVSL